MYIKLQTLVIHKFNNNNKNDKYQQVTTMNNNNNDNGKYQLHKYQLTLYDSVDWSLNITHQHHSNFYHNSFNSYETLIEIVLQYLGIVTCTFFTTRTNASH